MRTDVRPVIVLSMARSGSSLTAGAFARHGFWTGICKPADKHNERGYFQNEIIDRALTRLYPGRIYDRLQPMPSIPEWPRFIGNVLDWEGYEGGPWLVKTNVFTWPVWMPLDPVFVFVWRDVESVIASARKHSPGIPDDAWRKIVLAHHEEQRRVREDFGGFGIHSSRLVAGDYTEIEAVLDSFGFSLDAPGLDAFVDRKLWHEADDRTGAVPPGAPVYVPAGAIR